MHVTISALLLAATTMPTDQETIACIKYYDSAYSRNARIKFGEAAEMVIPYQFRKGHPIINKLVTGAVALGVEV